MHKVAIIGNIDDIYGFSSLGIEIFPVKDSKDALLKIKEISLDFGIIFIIDSLYNSFEDEVLKDFNNQVVPSIVPVMSMSSSVSDSSENLRILVKKAVGFDMLEKII